MSATSAGGGADSAGAHDSGGQHWSGRELSSSGFESDDGSPDPRLRGTLNTADVAETEVVEALAQSRLLVPIVATATGVDDSGPLAAESGTEMAVVTLTAPDGQRALPVFTGLDALAAWDPQARPSPVSADRAAQAALAENCDVVLVDLGSGWQRTLRSSMVWALAQQRPWLPAHTDPVVTQAVSAAAEAEDSCAGVACASHESGALRVELALRPGLTGEQTNALAARVGERLAADPQVRPRLDGVLFAVRPAQA